MTNTRIDFLNGRVKYICGDQVFTHIKDVPAEYRESADLKCGLIVKSGFYLEDRGDHEVLRGEEYKCWLDAVSLSQALHYGLTVQEWGAVKEGAMEYEHLVATGEVDDPSVTGY